MNWPPLRGKPILPVNQRLPARGMYPIRDISHAPIRHYCSASLACRGRMVFGKGAGVSMFSASVSARSVIVLTCTATAMLTAWIIAAAPAVGPDEGRVRILVGQVRPLGD